MLLRFQRLAMCRPVAGRAQLLKPNLVTIVPASIQVRYFAPRGIHREQMLEKEKRNRELFDKRMKPIDPEKSHELKYATSLKERQQMKKGDMAYDAFVTDSTQDAEMEKMIDSLIDEGMAKGKSDEQILAELGATMTGDGSGSHLTQEERREREESVKKELEASMGEGGKQAA